ncbi:hypothetical protein BCR32DRAFT_123190 [Anaeromyces robustus]|uniref:Uncharacterized protein n=1 Tax=Anaeromyces robustus TaxID=1754192 RepID=A0A1Y1VU75_9FUNG|nr:hypothetical protein BCR32DRAFT_123190 [Anaeromyces robustus]|eukprot:ORX64859.1 hypothetical protein BCR32DRAFT_123190 [Anaeromyces robustus]
MDALNAMEVLTGRQIDFEKGSILKAEMAKKNLHTKKTMMNMYYPTSSMKNACMQYHNMISDNVNNCINFNNNLMANNLCNQLLKDESNLYQLNNLNRGMNLPTNAGIGPLANNGIMLPGARDRNTNMNILNSTNQSFIDQNNSLFNANRNMFKLQNYQNIDMNHSNAAVSVVAMNNSKPNFDKIYKNIPGNNGGNPNGLKQQSLQNNLFSFNTAIQKPIQQPNNFTTNQTNFINNLYRQPSSLLDNDFSLNTNQFASNAANVANVTVATANHTNNNPTTNSSIVNNVTSKFNQPSPGIDAIDSSFTNNAFNLSLNYFTSNNDLMKNRTLHDNIIKDNITSPMDDLKKVSPLSTSSTTPLFFPSPINKSLVGFMDNNNGNNNNLNNNNGNNGGGNTNNNNLNNNININNNNTNNGNNGNNGNDKINISSSLMDPTNELNNKFYNLNINMVMDKTLPTSTTNSNTNANTNITNGKDNETFDITVKGDHKKLLDKSKEDLNLSNTNDFIKNNFAFNLFSNNNDTSNSILDSLSKNDSYGLISKLSSSSMNLPYKKTHFEKMASLTEKDLDLSLQTDNNSTNNGNNSNNDTTNNNEESTSTLGNVSMTNAKSSTASISNGSDFTYEGNTDNKTEPESSIFSSLSNLTSEPIIPPPQIYSLSVSQPITNEN